MGMLQSTSKATERIATGLGWFSVALGASQILAPARVARAAGLDPRRASSTTWIIGFRELIAGIGILSQPRSPRWLWMRVVGDVMDLAYLGSRIGARGVRQGRLAFALASVAGIGAADALTATRLELESTRQSERRNVSSRAIHVTKSITIRRKPEDVYRFWRALANLPQFMSHLESVQVVDGISHWKAKAPAGMTVEWDAEITDDVPGEKIAWRSFPGSLVPNEGSVRFEAAPGDRGTELFVELHYDPPLHAVGAALAKLFGKEPSQQIDGDLRRLKQFLETGEIMRSDASIHRGMHAARPSNGHVGHHARGQRT